MNARITTSWDDGHVLDFRLAELLARNGLSATFYIPREASSGVMSEEQVRELSQQFEIGAHTMRHVFLDTADDDTARREISESKDWVEQITGKPCPMFCPPAGKFNATHLGFIKASGFAGLRSVELLSIDSPRMIDRLRHLPTSVQVHPQKRMAYARNFAKRRAWGNAWRFVRNGGSTDWTRLAESLLDETRHRGGVFHLWGHSWEIEASGQWKALEEMLKLLGDAARQMPSLSNGQLCRDPHVSRTSS